MDSHFIENWSFSQQQSSLPYSGLVSIPDLLGVFRNTATSYKYLYFLSLLNILKESGFNRLKISLEDILLEMLSNAWFPHNFFKLNFGINDRIAQELDRLDLTGLENTVSNVKNSKDEIKAVILTKDFTKNHLMDLVPYRLLTPFFQNDLKGLTDAQRNQAIADLAVLKFDERNPFYLFSEDRKSIIMNPNWMLYFYENQEVLRSFICWNWLEYMQKRNPSVPNLPMKLFPPSKRNNLNEQTAFWKSVLEQKRLKCIFSGSLLSLDDLSVDHFLPWSFVAHDQLWNLIPVSRSINSSKSNNLPDMNMYFDQFVDLQHQGLSTYRKNPGKLSWSKVVEPYVNDLRVKPEDVLDRDVLRKSLKLAIEPLSHLAAAQGFCAGWVYG